MDVAWCSQSKIWGSGGLEDKVRNLDIRSRLVEAGQRKEENEMRILG